MLNFQFSRFSIFLKSRYFFSLHFFSSLFFSNKIFNFFFFPKNSIVLTGRNFTSAHSNFCISISLSTVPSLKKTKPHKSNQKTVFDINEIIQFQFDKNTPADLNITCYDSENVFTKKNTM